MAHRSSPRVPLRISSITSKRRPRINERRPTGGSDLVREERRAQAEIGRQEPNRPSDENGDDPNSVLIAALTRQFRAAGQSPALAAESARRFVACCREYGPAVDPASFLKILT
jgi:hypothetical protein